jgi:leucyl aminopeptidase
MHKLPAVTFTQKSQLKSDTLILPVAKGGTLTAPGKALDKDLGGLLTVALKRQKSFKAAHGQILTVTTPAHARMARVILVGVDHEKKSDPTAHETIGGKLAPVLQGHGAENVTLYIDAGAARIATGLMLKLYRFDIYRDKKKAADTAPTLKKLECVTQDSGSEAKIFKHESAVIDGVFLTRDLVNMPPNDLYPESYAARIKRDLTVPGMKIDILDEKKLKTLGFGAHLAVGQGSIRPPRVVIMEWNGLGATNAKSKTKPLALVGKGITFDTGGISLKPGGGMDEMKMDMAGSAAVVGTMLALARRKAKTHVVGIVALAENMPSDRAYRPGDIINSLAGKTIEVLNTDAEGRLVLCDSLTYVQKKYKPAAIIDLATLTGAIIVALGNEYCGSFVNNDALWDKISKAGKDTGEKFWRMPLDEAYRKDVESKVADLRNIGTAGKGGSCTAAAFLEWFIEDDMPWAHLDIAGTGMSSSVGGTGFGVRTLNRLIAEHYER